MTLHVLIYLIFGCTDLLNCSRPPLHCPCPPAPMSLPIPHASIILFVDFQIQFIVFRAWVGIWIAIIAVCLVAAEGSALASLLTRFSEEIFALLISLIFVYEVFK